MKTIIITIALSIFSIIMSAQTEDITTQGKTITVTIPMSSTEGKVGLALYQEYNFMKGEPFKGTNGKIKDGKVEVTFENVPDGLYAITVYHDKNDNDKMDFSDNKMPLESYGASNNVMSFGPPMWSDAKFEINGEDVVMEIRM